MGDVCEDCGKPWNSEYHMSDECVNIDEDTREYLGEYKNGM